MNYFYGPYNPMNEVAKGMLFMSAEEIEENNNWNMALDFIKIMEPRSMNFISKSLQLI